MAINKELFFKQLKRTALLMGERIHKETAEALYEELKEYDEADILNALKEIAYSENKLTLASLYKYVVKFRTQRIIEESERQKRLELERAKAFFASATLPAEIRDFIKKIKEG